jgi:hypothetical protein
MNSNWLVCWNFGGKSGDPMRPSPDPPVGIDGDAGQTARDDQVGHRPRNRRAGGRGQTERLLDASGSPATTRKRNSLTIADEITLVSRRPARWS